MMDLTEESPREARLEMIGKALKDKAPVKYAELESSGQLDQFLEHHDEAMMAGYRQAKQKAWEETVDTFLKFFDPCCDESSLPMG